MTDKKDAPAQAVPVQAEALPQELVPTRDNAILMALTRAEIDQQITTARAYPRSLTRFREDILSMATVDQETAESMYYQLPRDGKLVEGPSVRLAEIAASCWGNVRYGARVIETDAEFLTARGACHDLEKNNYFEIDVRRRVVNKYGKRFSLDMIQTTGGAASSIALRNAIFKIVPRAFIKPAMEAAKRVAAGDEKTLVARRDAAMLFFKDKGVKPDRVFALLGPNVKGKDDITLEHLGALSGVRQALKDGEATIEEFFPASNGEPAKGAVSVDSLTAGADVKAKDQPEPPDSEDKAKGKGKKGSAAEKASGLF